MVSPIETLRAWITRVAKPPFSVTAKREQYWCDEDSAFYTDIDVQHPVDQFVLIVVSERSESRANEFLRRVLHDRAPEVWLVNEHEPRVVASHVGHDAVVLTRGDVLVSRQVPGVRIAIDELYPAR